MRCEKCVQQMKKKQKKLDNTNGHSSFLATSRSWRRPGWPIHQNGLHNNNNKTKAKKNKIRRLDSSKGKSRRKGKTQQLVLYPLLCYTFKRKGCAYECVCVCL